MAKDSKDGFANFIGGALTFLVVAIVAIPKAVWIAIGILVAVAVLIGIIIKVANRFEKRRAEATVREKARRLEREALNRQQREANARKEKEKRIDALGMRNAELLDSAKAAVKCVVATEAARAGWLGDCDFTADLQAITGNFEKTQNLRKVARELSDLANPTNDDRAIIAEATTTAANLERTARDRVGLIAKCAVEARRIDESLSAERKNARTAEQRAELHAQLSSMLYGIKAAPAATPEDSSADSVMARVRAYREIKNQIQRASDGERQ